MRTVDLIELSRLENFEVSSLFAIKQNWREGHIFVMDKPRKQNAFLWFCGTDGEFTLKSGDKLSIPHGALVSIPQGSEYSVRFFNRASSPSTVLVEFCLDKDGAFGISEKIEILEKSLEDRQIIEALMKLTADFSIPSRPWLDLMSCFYGLMSLLASREERKSLRRKGLQTIEKGIRYLQIDEAQRLSLDEVAAMCFVTPAYFRRLFREYAGMSPSEYRAKRKIERAKELILHSSMSVAEISEHLGYETPSYFCRVFKKAVGLPPSEYAKSGRSGIEK